MYKQNRLVISVNQYYSPTNNGDSQTQPDPFVTPAQVNAFIMIAIWNNIIEEEEINSRDTCYSAPYCAKKPVPFFAGGYIIKRTVISSLSPNLTIDNNAHQIGPCREEDIWLSLTHTKF